MSDHMLTAEQLEAIAKRAEAATPEPWAYHNDIGDRWIDRGEENDEEPVLEFRSVSHENGRFIAHAREDIPALLRHVEALQHRVDFLENMYLERRTDHEEAMAAQKRAERLEAALSGLVLLIEQMPEVELRLRHGGLKRARTALEEAG